jgi:outer membrane protein assembly factor BamB
VKVQRDGERWTAVEAWRTTRFTPKFNDFVCVDEHIYGLDDGRLVCFSLAKKAVVWKEGHYDAGQLLLVGDKLLVLSEKGHLACVPARSDEYEELWKMKLADGKAWNHLALARGRLYFRNATVMVAYDLPGWKDKE